MCIQQALSTVLEQHLRVEGEGTVAISQAVSHPCGTSLLSWVSWHPGIFCGWSFNTAGLHLCSSSSREAVAWPLPGWEVLTRRKSCLVRSVCLTPKAALNSSKQISHVDGALSGHCLDVQILHQVFFPDSDSSKA